MLLIEHIWTVSYQTKPIVMYGWFKSQDAFNKFALYEMSKWNASIQQGETKEHTEEYYRTSLSQSENRP